MLLSARYVVKATQPHLGYFVPHTRVRPSLQVENAMSTYIPDAMVVVYSVDSLESIKEAEETLRYLWDTGSCMNKAVILVGNKTDLVRTRVVDITSELLRQFSVRG